MPENETQKRLQALAKGLSRLLSEFDRNNPGGNPGLEAELEKAAIKLTDAMDQMRDGGRNLGIIVIAAARALRDFIEQPKRTIRAVRVDKLPTA
jgi:hypothetical protein